MTIITQHLAPTHIERLVNWPEKYPRNLMPKFRIWRVVFHRFIYVVCHTPPSLHSYHIFSSPTEVRTYTHLLSHDTYHHSKGSWLRDKYEYLKLELGCKIRIGIQKATIQIRISIQRQPFKHVKTTNQTRANRKPYKRQDGLDFH